MSDENTNNDEKLPIKDDLNEADAVNAEVDLDDSKAKFLNGGKGMDESEVVVEVPSSTDESFTGLGKDELMEYVNDPFWKRLRIILFVLFWIGWLAMLVAAIVIIVLAPRCPYRPDLKWYNKDTVYDTYVKSFKDKDGNGIGDLQGVESKADYFKALGAKAISLGDIFKKDTGNGVVDFKDVDANIGTLGDIDTLVTKFKKTGTGIKVVVDFDPNHTSKKHEWFVESSKSKDNKYASYYVWADGVGSGPPNNWKTMNGDSAWTLDSTRGQYYLHQMGADYPDLNLTNPEVITELEDAMRFWLKKGLYGFNLKSAEFLVEEASLADEVKIGSGNTYDDFKHNETRNTPGTLAVIQKFRSVVDSFSDKPGRERVLYTSLKYADTNQTRNYYGSAEGKGVHMVLGSFLSSDLVQGCDAACFKKGVEDELSSDNVNTWLGWMLGSDVTSRLSNRVPKKELMSYALAMTLPGTPFIYYGDEIGMEDGKFDPSMYPNATTDNNERQYLKYRTPMQWDTSANSGFTSGTPWIPVNSDGISVGAENAHFKDDKILENVKKLIKIREAESLQFGKITIGMVSEMVWYVRQAEGFPGYLVAANFGSYSVAHRFSDEQSVKLPEKATVKFHSHKGSSDDKIDISNTYIEVAPGAAIILELDIPAE